jgi:hypothetical protein
MPARTRTRNTEATHCGTLMYFGSPVVDCMVLGTREDCEDVVGNREDANILSLKHTTRNFPALVGGAGTNKDFQHFPIGYHATFNPDPRAKFPLPNLAEMNAIAWKILAETNPSRPHVNVPAFLGELKDIPQLVRGWGQGIIRDVAKGNISYKFGIAPMISDIKKMTNFVKVSNERFTQLRRLRDGKTMRRRIALGYTVVNDTYGDLFHSLAEFIYGTRSDTYTLKAWGTAEWKLLPDSDLPDMSDEELMKFTRKLVSGATGFGALEAAWELVPWSWFVDWFSNVGDLLAASNNSVSCTWGRLCYMMTTTGRSVISVDPASVPGYLTLSGDFNLKVIRKDRLPVYPIIPVPLPYLPILDGGKLSILASLAALRR